MLKEVWVSAAGSTYRAAADDFINAQIPFYYSGSWQVANLSTKIGDAFDWVATGSPCGTAACSGLQGGAALVAIKYTKNPEEVAKVMEYLGQRAGGEGVHRAHPVPAGPQGRHRQAAASTSTATTRTSSRRWRSSSPPPSSSPRPPQLLPPWKWANAYYAALVTRTSQVMAGELPLDDAFARMDQDIADQVAQAQQ